MRLFLLLLLTISFPVLCFSQNKITPKVYVTEGDSLQLPKKKFLKSEYENDLLFEKDLRYAITFLHSSGFIEASADSFFIENDTAHIFLHLGPRYVWGELRKGNLEGGLADEIGWKRNNFDADNFNYNEVERLLDKILTYYENNGFPFAAVSLDSVEINDNKISAALDVQKNQMFVFDTLALIGDTKVSKKYLYGYLGIKPKSLYNESAVRKVNKRLREVPFVQVEKPVQVFFLRDQAKLNLFLKDRKTSRFDFLLGILPNNEITGRVLITGEVLMHLMSAFGRGEEFFINWKRLQARTQSLDAAFRYPYLAGSPIGVDLNFNLYKRDTLYLDLDYEIGFQFLFIGGNYFKTFVHYKSTNVLTVDTNFVINTRSLPAINDVRNTFFGVEYFNENLDYRFNPTDGFSLKAKVYAGRRKISELSEITSLSDPENPGGTFETLYDSIDLNSIQYRFALRFDKFWKIAKRSTVKTGINGGAVFGKNIFFNELFRIGGSRLLRGFDEESISTSHYYVLTAEYRFLLSQNSHFQIFFDGAFVENKSIEEDQQDFPFGFGAGLNFETKAGVFGVSYALGRQQNNPIDFKSAKVHFGYVNYF